MNKRGRACNKDSRGNQYRLRMSDEEVEMLNNLSVKTHKTKAEILREALKMYHNLTIFQD